MFSAGRILFLAILGAVCYLLFLAVPGGERAEGRYDPAALADAEVAVWKAAQIREEFGVYTNTAAMLRERHRYTWFRAAQASYYLGRATLAFPGMRDRYQRVLPDLEAAATIHRDWVGAAYTPSTLAQTQLAAWITRQTQAKTAQQLAPFLAEEFAMQYGIPPGAAAEAALLRAEASLLFDTGGIDPDLTAVARRLTDSYRSLQGAIAKRSSTQ